MGLAQIEKAVVDGSAVESEFRAPDPGERATPFDHVFQLTDMCANNGVKVSFRAEPPGKQAMNRLQKNV